MRLEVFHSFLTVVCEQLTDEAQSHGFQKSLQFENRVREVIQEVSNLIDLGQVMLFPLYLHGI